MDLIQLPISILDNILNNVHDTYTYSSIRISCKSIYYLLPEVKRYYTNGRLKEIFVFMNHKLNGYHILWYINENVSNMVLYVENNKHREEINYYPSGDVRRVTTFNNGILDGFEKIYSNSDKILLRQTEYKDDKKVNQEMIYNNKGYMLYKIIYIDDNIYSLTYYDYNFRTIKGTFVNDILQGNHTTYLLHPNNIKYYKFNKQIVKYNYGNVDNISLYNKDSLVENFSIKNGKKNGWAYKWHPNHKLKSMAYFSNNQYEKKYKIWHDNFSNVETFEFKNNKLNGLYKTSCSYFEKIIPYYNNKINGYVEENIKCANSSLKLKFKNNKFDGVVKIKNEISSYEIYLDTDYFVYTKYRYEKKIYTLKIINNFVSLTYFDPESDSTILHNYSCLLPPYYSIAV